METGDTDKIATAPGGKYQIVEPLQTGGTAAIYLAVMRGENDFTREVVIKRPLPHLVADRRLRAMFIDEAHIASRLSHPNLVQVIDLVARSCDPFAPLKVFQRLGYRLPERVELRSGVQFEGECRPGPYRLHRSRLIEAILPEVLVVFEAPALPDVRKSSATIHAPAALPVDSVVETPTT